MKHCFLTGFAAFIIMSDASGKISVKNTKTGKTVVPKSGSVKIKCDSDVNAEDGSPMFTAGTEYQFSLKDLAASCEGSWIDGDGTAPKVAPKVDVEETRTAEQIELDNIKAQNSAKLKELKATMDNANKNMLANITDEKLFTEWSGKLRDAKLAYDTFKASVGGAVKEGKAKKAPKEKKVKEVRVKSEQELASEALIATLRQKVEDAKTELAEQIEKHNSTEGWGKIGKSGGGGKGSGGGGSKERILDYDKAQVIRKEYAEMLKGGKSANEAVNACVDAHGIDRVAILRVINYRQHLLKREDEAFLKVLPFNTEYHNKFAGEDMPEGCTSQNDWYKKKSA